MFYEANNMDEIFATLQNTILHYILWAYHMHCNLFQISLAITRWRHHITVLCEGNPSVDLSHKIDSNEELWCFSLLLAFISSWINKRFARDLRHQTLMWHHCNARKFETQCHPVLGHLRMYRTSMMTSSNGNDFHVTAPVWGESTGHRWIPLTKGQ